MKVALRLRPLVRRNDPGTHSAGIREAASAGDNDSAFIQIAVGGHAQQSYRYLNLCFGSGVPFPNERRPSQHTELEASQAAWWTENFGCFGWSQPGNSIFQVRLPRLGP